jgi:hypothetical protein
MAVSTEIVRSWRAPGAAIRRQLDAGVGEARALAYLMAACGLIFVAQWPRLSREAHLNPDVPLEALMAGALQGIVFILPLLLYGVAAISHLVARAFGGCGSWLGARLALFWTLLATAPLFLLHGLVAGFLGPGAALNAAGIVLSAGFLGHWLLALAGAEARVLEAGDGRA